MTQLNTVRLLAEKADVTVDGVNRGFQDLARRTDVLLALIESAGLGRNFTYDDLACESSVAIGDAVAWDSENSRLVKALLTIGYDNNGTWGELANTARVIGIVVAKSGPATASIITCGIYDDTDGNILTTSDPTGVYYLSSSTAGQLTFTRQPMSPAIGFWVSERKSFLVYPTDFGSGREHEHLTIELTAEPAGIPNNPVTGENHGIVTPNTSTPGWLPADNAIFGGLAPVGAKFGYNIAQHAGLQDIFPPVPLGACNVDVFRSGYGTSRSDDIVVVTSSGIWWMENSFGWAPWSADWWEIHGGTPAVGDFGTATRSAPVDARPENHEVGETQAVRIMLHMFKRMEMDTGGFVGSLVSGSSGLRLTSCDTGEPASTGNLSIELALSLATSIITDPGTLALKNLQASSAVYGPIVASLKSASPYITLTGTRTLVNGTESLPSGHVTIGYNDPRASDVTLTPREIRLDGVVEEFEDNITYLAFRKSRTTSMGVKLEVPVYGTTYDVNYTLSIVGTAAGSIPALSVQVVRVPIATSTPTTLTLTPVSIGSTAATAVGAGQQVAIQLPEFQAAAGDTVFVTMTRAGTTDGYTGDVRVLRQTAQLTLGA